MSLPISRLLTQSEAPNCSSHRQERARALRSEQHPSRYAATEKIDLLSSYLASAAMFDVDESFGL